MKKIARMVMALSVASLATTMVSASDNPPQNYKGYKGQPVPQYVTIPTFAGSFNVTLAALYLKPTSDGLEYANSSTTLTTTSNEVVSESSAALDPNYFWGFILGAGYVIANSSNDIQVNWMHFNHADNANTTFYGPPAVLPANTTETTEVISTPSNLSLPLTSPTNYANTHGNVKHELDAVDFDYGQFINITPRFQTRIFAGLRWAQIKRTLNPSVDAVTDESVNGAYNAASVTSKFNGLGPLLGANGNYLLGSGFGAVAGVDMALLAGNIHLKDSTTGFFEARNQQVTVDYDTLYVAAPAFDAKLGLSYTYIWNTNTTFRLELGYMVSKYIDVIEQNSRDFDVTSLDYETSNFGLNGGYLLLSVGL